MSDSNRSLRMLDSAECKEQKVARTDPRAQLIVTLLFVVVELSLPVTDTADLILCFIFPIANAAANNVSYRRALLLSLVAVPFATMVGIFNPITDRTAMFEVGAVVVTRGWITFTSIVLRGVVSVEAVAVLIESVGFYGLCRALRRLGMPSIVTVQLLMTYRYLRLTIEQAEVMRRARQARSFGRKRLNIKMWGVLVGQLLIRTLSLSERIARAMNARGFDRTIDLHFTERRSWRKSDTWYLIGWSAAFAVLLAVRPATLFVLP